MIPRSINKIIDTLANTKFEYNDNYLKDPENDSYCATAVLILECGFHPREFEGGDEYYNLCDLQNYNSIIPVLESTYDINFINHYKRRFTCPLSFDCNGKIHNFEQALTHLNDEHNYTRTHKETARTLKTLSCLYNLETGERTFEKI